MLRALSVLATLWAPTIRADEPVRVSFQHDVVPILTKLGCNSGACHGTPTGKNGFRLSLRGYDPESDIQSLTRDVQGRRVERTQPDASLILLKATGQIPHEGGRRLTQTHPLFALLRQWIAEGAVDDLATAPKLAQLEVRPPRYFIR